MRNFKSLAYDSISSRSCVEELLSLPGILAGANRGLRDVLAFAGAWALALACELTFSGGLLTLLDGACVGLFLDEDLAVAFGSPFVPALAVLVVVVARFSVVVLALPAVPAFGLPALLVLVCALPLFVPRVFVGVLDLLALRLFAGALPLSVPRVFAALALFSGMLPVLAFVTVAALPAGFALVVAGGLLLVPEDFWLVLVFAEPVLFFVEVVLAVAM